MAIYEVNITINNDIFDEYYNWLIEHIKIMLRFDGFHHAEISEEKQNLKESTHNKKITVRYTLASEKDLDHYLKNHAKIMREEAIQKFGAQFSVFRRIFSEPVFLDLKN